MSFLNFKISKLLSPKTRFNCIRNLNRITGKPPWKVLFFGADEFSIFSLRALVEEYRKGILLNKLEVVTTIKGKLNPVKILSQKEKIYLHKWPPDLAYGQFDVGLVVSFGHLIPNQIIEKFEYGMLNVHASLLPRWRGAAPIIYAIANGDTQTGITIMKISPTKFDIGEIVSQESVPIGPHMKMGALFTKLGTIGASSLIKTLASLPQSLTKAYPQPPDGVAYAPKISPEFANIDWNTMTSKQVYDLGRALEGVFYPQTTWKGTAVKLINVYRDDISTTCDKSDPGYVEYDQENQILKILCSDAKCIIVEKVRVAGKKVMTAKEFSNGYLKKEPPDCRYFK